MPEAAQLVEDFRRPGRQQGRPDALDPQLHAAQTRNTDVQNRMKGAIEDCLFELMEREKLELTFEEIDRILDSVLDIARVRYA